MPSPDELAKRAEALLGEFLTLARTQDEADFEAFAAGHPEEAPALRELYQAWLAMEEYGAHVPAQRPRLLRVTGEPREGAVEPVQQGDEPSSAAALLGRLHRRVPAEPRYEFVDEVGQGGMGQVNGMWDRDLRRRVAMKMALDPGRAGGRLESSLDERERAFLERFFGEAQVTGQLEHPGIVPVYDIGVDEQGQVFFTMRLVKGETLGAIIRKARAAEGEWNRTRALGVMLKVCETMAYAHEKGVIHRDLKPENVMVGRFGEVYVMDWGLARVQGRPDAHEVRLRLDETRFQSAIQTVRGEDEDSKTPFDTAEGDVLGTPSYMPPEQARGNLDEIAQRSDVYSTGAILYHLLTGRAPFTQPGERVERPKIIWRLIEGPGPRPVPAIDPSVPGELVAICEKAMAREAEDRYPSMAEMAEDLRAYLENRVVRAYEQGALADLRKWVGRNRALAATVLVALAIALVGLTSTTYVYARGKERADSATSRAEEAAAVAEAVSEFMNHDLLLSALDPNVVLGQELTVREVLDQARVEVDGAFAGQPAVREKLYRTIGESYLNLGQFEAAIWCLERSLELSEELHGDEGLELAEVLFLLAEALHRGRADDASAVRLALRAERLQALRLEPTDPRRARGRIKATELLAFASGRRAPEITRRHLETWGAFRVQSRVDEQQKTNEELLELVNESIVALDSIWAQGKQAEAAAFVSGLLEPVLQVPGLGSDVAFGVNAFGTTLSEQGRYPHAGAALISLGMQWCLEDPARGPEHRQSLLCRRNWAQLQAREGDHEAAAATMQDVIRITRRIQGAEHRDSLLRLCELGRIHLDARRFDQAEECLTEVLEIGRRFDPYREETLAACDALARLRFEQGELRAAQSLLSEALEHGPPEGPGHEARKAFLLALAEGE